MSDTDLEIAPYLALMVKKDGEDMYLHTGAKILIKGAFGFAWIGEKLVAGQVDRIFRTLTSDRKIMEFEEHGEVDFSLGIPNLGRFRGSAFKQRGETSLVFRYVHNEIPTVEQLGLPTVLNDLVMEKNGLIVVVGSTGSGKSTSLAAMIDHRNSNAAKQSEQKPDMKLGDSRLDIQVKQTVAHSCVNGFNSCQQTVVYTGNKRDGASGYAGYRVRGSHADTF